MSYKQSNYKQQTTMGQILKHHQCNKALTNKALRFTKVWALTVFFGDFSDFKMILSSAITRLHIQQLSRVIKKGNK